MTTLETHPKRYPKASERNGFMDKRQFLKTSSAFMAGTLFSRLTSAESANAASPLTNWAGNLHYHAQHLYTPATTAELQETVKKLTNLRALGSRHSFNTIADSVTNQISTAKLGSMEFNAEAKTVTVGAGVRYGTCGRVQPRRG